MNKVLWIVLLHSTVSGGKFDDDDPIVIFLLFPSFSFAKLKNGANANPRFEIFRRKYGKSSEIEVETPRAMKKRWFDGAGTWYMYLFAINLVNNRVDGWV